MDPRRGEEAQSVEHINSKDNLFEGSGVSVCLFDSNGNTTGRREKLRWHGPLGNGVPILHIRY